MDLGCLDLGCISSSDEKQTTDASAKLATGETRNSSSATIKVSKNKSPRSSPPSGGNALNRLVSQIKKPPHRKTAPINWFPRKKMDSYLNRKIKLLQEAGGMNDTLDETLGHSNPHYCRVEREKMAVREAARKVMNARKAAMVEASWCRILQAARIPNKEADALLLKAENDLTEAFEAAKAKGVIMYDTPDRPWKHLEIETSAGVSGKGSTTTHTIKASFETAFEVDKQVAAAVKTAFIRLAHCSCFNKDEFKDLLRKISENPDNQELSESDTGSEFEKGPQDEDDGSSYSSQRRNRKKLSPEKYKGSKLVGMMLERLKCLKEEELASLATIVATCGLNAALASTEGHHHYNRVQNSKPELPSLDKFLVKKLTRLEKEVQEAKNNARKAESIGSTSSEVKPENQPVSSSVDDEVSDLGSVLVKHSSKLEKEIEEAKRNQEKLSSEEVKLGRTKNHGRRDGDMVNVPSLDKFLVKHESRLEREVREARNRRTDSTHISQPMGKENVDSNKSLLPLEMEQEKSSLDKMLVKPLHRLEREKMQVISEGGGEWRYIKQAAKTNGGAQCEESLDEVLVKHVSKLEKEKMGLGDKQQQQVVEEVKKKETTGSSHLVEASLDQILVKHKSRLEREKTAAQNPEDGQTSSSSYARSRREARERELLEAWGGIGLGCSMQPRASRLEREKAAWLKAEEEERRAAGAVV